MPRRPSTSPRPAPTGLGADALSHLFESSLDGILVVDAQHSIRYANPAAAEIAGTTREQLAAQDLLALFPQAERADLTAHLAIGPGVRSERRSTTVVRPDGERREVEYTVTGVGGEHEPLAVITLHDVTETRRVLRWTAALAQVASSVAYAGTLETTLSALARTIVRVTGGAACTVVLIEDDDRHSWRVAASFGLPEGYVQALEAVWRTGVLLPSVDAYEQRRPVVRSDVRREIAGDPRCAPLHPFLDAVTWDTLVAVPLVVRGQAVGSLVGYYTPEQAPREDDIAFLSIIADQAAVAVENARLFVEAQGKAALEERQRLARELHDSVSQALYGIALGARTARELLERNPPQAIGPIDYVASLAEAGLAEMRALIFELRPESLEAEGLVAAIAKQAAALRARHGIEVETSLDDEPDIPLHVKEALYRIAQEALHNIVRHARATLVHVSLRPEGQHDPSEHGGTGPAAPTRPTWLVLEVQDNGQGFEPEGPFPGHLGLRSMRERAAILGGTLEIHSAPGAGARVTARIPISR